MSVHNQNHLHFHKPGNASPFLSAYLQGFIAGSQQGQNHSQMPEGFSSLIRDLIGVLERLTNTIDMPVTTQPVGGGSSQPPVTSEAPIAGEAKIWGDPHFVGADGGKYDIQGEAGKIYNLLSDSNFQMNGRFDAWGSGGATVVGEVGIVVPGGEIEVSKTGDVFVNDRQLMDGESVTLDDGTKISKDGDKIHVKSAEWDVTFTAKDSSKGEYLNIDIKTDNAIADGVKPHGLIGQTFDGDGEAREGDKGSGAQGGGAIDALDDAGNTRTDAGDKTSVERYEADDIFDTEFDDFDRYDENMPPPEPAPIAGTARIWGDPHFIGADGGKYDVQGEAGETYNLLSDSNFQMNGRFDAWGSGGATVVGEVGIVVPGGEIEVSKTGDVFVNDRQLMDGESVTLDDGTKISKDGDKIHVESAEWDVTFTAKNSSKGAYLNIDISTENAIADGVKPHGLIGQTFDGDGQAREGDKGKNVQGGGAIDALEGGVRTETGDVTSIERYEVDDIFDTEFDNFDRYDADGGNTTGGNTGTGSGDPQDGLIQAGNGQWYANDLTWPIFDGKYIGNPSSLGHEPVDLEEVA